MSELSGVIDRGGPPAPVPAASPEMIGRGAWTLAWYGLAVLIVATVLAAVDRQILVLLAEPIRRSLGLSDTKLGLLQGAGIALFAGLAAVPLGWLADRYGRRSVLAACVLVWSAATAACGLAWDFVSLFAAAIGLGIGEAGLAPIVYGLIPEMIPERRRVLANGIYAVAAIFGAGLGIGLSGTLISSVPRLQAVLPSGMQAMEPWRLSFFAVALPGPVIAASILLIRLRKTKTSLADDATFVPTRLGDYFADHGRTVFGIFGGTGMAQLGIAALAAWAPVIVSRSFPGTPQQVGQGIGAAYLLGTVVGAIVGGFGVKRLRRVVGIATPVRVIAIGQGLSALAAAALAVAASALQVYVLFGLQVTFLIAGSVVAPTLLQDMTPATLRSRVIAIGSVVSVLLSALSPVLVGLLSDRLAARADGLALSVAAVAAVSLGLGAYLTKLAEPSFVRTVEALGNGPEPTSVLPTQPTAALPSSISSTPPSRTGADHG